MGHRVYITDAEWLEEQRKRFENYFVKRAEAEILGYNHAADLATDAPWCQPWKWSEGYNIRKPEDWFEMIKKNLENVVDKDFYYGDPNQLESDFGEEVF